MSPDEVRQFLIECATDDMWKKYAHNLCEENDKSVLNSNTISKWGNFFKKQVTLVIFERYTWNEHDSTYDEQESVVEYANDSKQIPGDQELFYDRVVYVLGSQLQTDEYVWDGQRIWKVVEAEHGHDLWHSGTDAYKSVSPLQTYQAIVAYSKAHVFKHEEFFNQDEDYDDM